MIRRLTYIWIRGIVEVSKLVKAFLQSRWPYFMQVQIFLKHIQKQVD